MHILELFDTPVGYVAFDATTIRHLGVVRHQTRRGYGSALMEFASLEIFSGGAREAELWVLVDNEPARASTVPITGRRPTSGESPSTRPIRRAC